MKGHHKTVATPEDPASANINEYLHSFVWRSFTGSYKSVWNYETIRLRNKVLTGKEMSNGLFGMSPEFSINNRMISYNIAHTLYIAGVAYFFGMRGFIFVMSYAIIVAFFQEAINYVEHYGLKRTRDKNGIYEPVNINHSWNAPHRYSNYILFKLQRHSDHHANAYKPYQILNTYEDSPTLLVGYSVALVT